MELETIMDYLKWILLVALLVAGLFLFFKRMGVVFA